MKVVQIDEDGIEGLAALHDDGTVSLRITLRRKKPKTRRRPNNYVVCELNKLLPFEVQCHEFKVRPRLIIRLAAKLRGFHTNRRLQVQLKRAAYAGYQMPKLNRG